MIETEYRLEGFLNVTLDANGTGSVLSVGPSRPNERWEIERFSTECASGCTLQIYRGRTLNSRYQLDYTDRGDGDTSETALTLRVGEVFSIRYANGVAGAIATLRYEGSYFVPGKRAY